MIRMWTNTALLDAFEAGEIAGIEFPCRYLTDACGAAAATAGLAVAFSVSLGTAAISGGL